MLQWHVDLHSKGPIGVDGPIGPIGETGVKGDQGFKGDKGVDGIKGEKVRMIEYEADRKRSLRRGQGDQGIEGKLGPRGLTGEKGDTGEVSEIISRRAFGTSAMIFRQAYLVLWVLKVCAVQSFLVH